MFLKNYFSTLREERGGSVVECRTPEREVRGSRPTAAVLCPWARHFTPRKYWLITQEAIAPSWHDWKIVDWDVKPQHNQPKHPTTPEAIPWLVCHHMLLRAIFAPKRQDFAIRKCNVFVNVKKVICILRLDYLFNVRRYYTATSTW